MPDISTLFGFRRPLTGLYKDGSHRVKAEDYPAGSKIISTFSPAKVKGVEKDYTTLSNPLIKAIVAYVESKITSAPMHAIGMAHADGFSLDYYVAEYQSSSSGRHLAIYTGNDWLACSIDSTTLEYQQYVLDESKEASPYVDGTVLFMSIIPVLMKNVEFRDHINDLIEMKLKPIRDVLEERRILGILCDNVYYRILSEKIFCPIPEDGKFTRLTEPYIDSSTINVSEVLTGTFQVFSQDEERGTKSASEEFVTDAERYFPLAASDFRGQFSNPDRVLTDYEKSKVPNLVDEVVPYCVFDICRHIKESIIPFRNIMLRGPSGTGKTTNSQLTAMGFESPYAHVTCNPGMEVIDFFGQFAPQVESGDKKLDFSLNDLFDSLALPKVHDIKYDPGMAYEMLTGIKPASIPSEQTCYDALIYKVASTIMQSVTSGSQQFTFTETNFIEGMRNGWVVEIQEPNAILQAGVLIGLNSLLEQNGSPSYRLSNGEIVYRHPETVVILTMNKEYEGVYPLAQSVIDRMNMVVELDAPPIDEMMKRATAITGFKEEVKLRNMAESIIEISNLCKAQKITDGVCGMRSLLDWIASYLVTKDERASALQTVVSKTTEDEEKQQEIADTIINNKFGRVA